MDTKRAIQLRVFVLSLFTSTAFLGGRHHGIAGVRRCRRLPLAAPSVEIGIEAVLSFGKIVLIILIKPCHLVLAPAGIFPVVCSLPSAITLLATLLTITGPAIIFAAIRALITGAGVVAAPADAPASVTVAALIAPVMAWLVSPGPIITFIGVGHRGSGRAGVSAFVFMTFGISRVISKSSRPAALPIGVGFIVAAIAFW